MGEWSREESTRQTGSLSSAFSLIFDNLVVQHSPRGGGKLCRQSNGNNSLRKFPRFLQFWSRYPLTNADTYGIMGTWEASKSLTDFWQFGSSRAWPANLAQVASIAGELFQDTHHTIRGFSKARAGRYCVSQGLDSNPLAGIDLTAWDVAGVRQVRFL